MYIHSLQQFNKNSLFQSYCHRKMQQHFMVIPMMTISCYFSSKPGKKILKLGLTRAYFVIIKPGNAKQSWMVSESHHCRILMKACAYLEFSWKDIIYEPQPKYKFSIRSGVGPKKQFHLSKVFLVRFSTEFERLRKRHQ